MTEYRDEAEPDDQRCREADRLHERAIDLCYVLNDYDKAVEALRKAVALRESILGKYNNDTALSYFRLFTILYGYKKENKEALMISRRELRISRLVLSIPLPGSGAAENHSTPVTEGVLANRISWISKVFQEENGTSKQKAKEYCSQLIKSMELERVGDVHFHERDYETAITKYDFSFTLESSSFARNFLDMADLNVKIGDCWFELEQYDKAMEEYEIAQSRYKDVFGENHSTVATVLRKSASVHLKTSKFNDALCK
jgi:tetratricopeptide (TPR) repeat protein